MGEGEQKQQLKFPLLLPLFSPPVVYCSLLLSNFFDCAHIDQHGKGYTSHYLFLTKCTFQVFIIQFSLTFQLERRNWKQHGQYQRAQYLKGNNKAPFTLSWPIWIFPKKCLIENAENTISELIDLKMFWNKCPRSAPLAATDLALSMPRAWLSPLWPWKVFLNQ